MCQVTGAEASDLDDALPTKGNRISKGFGCCSIPPPHLGKTFARCPTYRSRSWRWMGPDPKRSTALLQPMLGPPVNARQATSLRR